MENGIIDNKEVYKNSILYGLLWIGICFLFCNGQNNKEEEEEYEIVEEIVEEVEVEENENENEKNKNKKNKESNQIEEIIKEEETDINNRFLIQHKYQKIVYPAISGLIAFCVFFALNLITLETGVSYQTLLPAIQLILLVQNITMAFYWIMIFNKKYSMSYFLSTILFITFLYIYFAIMNLPENVNDENIATVNKIDKKPLVFVGIAIVGGFYLCVISMVYSITNNQNTFMNTFGSALIKFLNIKPENGCNVNEINNNENKLGNKLINLLNSKLENKDKNNKTKTKSKSKTTKTTKKIVKKDKVEKKDKEVEKKEKVTKKENTDKKTK